MCLMILHDGKDKSLYHLAFVGAQMIGMLLMGAFVFHARDCGGVETSTGGCVEYAGAGFDCAVLGSALSVCAWYLFAALIEPQQAAHLTTPRISFATFLRLQALLRCPMILASLIHLTSMPKSEPEALLYTYFPGYVVEVVLGGVVTLLHHNDDQNGDEKCSFIKMKRLRTFDDLPQEKKTQVALPIHIAYTKDRYDAVIAIAFGESLLQLTGATSTEVWEPKKAQMLTACFGFVLIYMLGQSYYHLCSNTDHALMQSDLRALVWFEMHPLVIFSLVLVGAGFEATHIANDANGQLTDRELAGMVLGVLANATFLHILWLLNGDSTRKFSCFPLQATIFFLAIPLGLKSLVLVCLSDSVKDYQVYNQILLMSVIICVDSMYCAYLANKLFFCSIEAHFTSTRSDIDSKRMPTQESTLQTTSADLQIPVQATSQPVADEMNGMEQVHALEKQGISMGTNPATVVL